MKRLTKNDRGFTVVEILLVLVTLAVIGVGGFYVAKHVNNKTASSTATESANNTPVSTPKEYLKITQLGIKIPLASSNSDLGYTWNDINHSATIGSISLMQKAKSDDPVNCTQSRASLTKGLYPVSRIVSKALADTMPLTYLKPGQSGGPDKVVVIGDQKYYWYQPHSGEGCDISGTSAFTTKWSAYYDTALSGFESALVNQ